MRIISMIMMVIGAAMIMIGVACDPVPVLTSKSTQDKSQGYLNYYEVKLDGCEYYATLGWGGYRTLTHKGNCRNPIHKCQ